MALTSGSRVGSYEVVSLLGEGGMGQVYRARDARLKRDVALKVLPEAFATDPDRVARFQREAELLATLNHSNIAGIYGLEQSDGMRALVLELVEGPTLADRIAQGPIPVDEALLIAGQIADALEAAHEKGVIHRDLKPANIKLTSDDRVKVLDFGLAKMLENPVAPTTLSMSPTLSVHATHAGVILGTAAYMSPEQARGKPVDKRADIWAFGCVLYEMLTGEPPFKGDDVAEVIGAIIHKDPGWDRLSPSMPAAVRTVLPRCLDKDPKQRVRDVGDVRLLLSGAFAAPVQTQASPPATRSRVGILTAVVAVLSAAFAAGAVWMVRAPVAPDPITFTMETPGAGDPDALALSPDGRQLAFVALDTDGQQRLWIRSLSSVTARVIPGTEFATAPFWSPDSSTVAFFSAGTLKSVALAGGAPMVLAKTATTLALGGTWSERNEILFSRFGAGIFRVNGGGGEPQVVVASRDNERYGWPVFLPGGRQFLYLSTVPAKGLSELRWRDLETKSERAVREVRYKAAYAAGQLLFRLDGPLVAQPFDPSTGQLSGNLVQVAPDIWTNGVQGRMAFTLSTSGVLAYRAGQGSATVAHVSWVNRSGNVVSTVGSPGDYRNLAVDPTGEHLAVNVTDGAEDVWILDTKRGTTSRLTFDAATDSDPVFSPDGKTVAFYSIRNPPGIYRKAASGAGPEELIAATGLQSWPRDWSSDGRLLLYQKVRDLWVVPLDGDRKPFPYRAATGRDGNGRFSPDTRWVVYESDETGRPEIFVQDFPAKGAKFQVSTEGGSEPRWRRDGRELFYLGTDGRLMSVSVDRTPELKLGVPTPLFQTAVMTLPLPPQRRFGVSPDGQRFVMNIPGQGSTVPPVTVSVNWLSALNRK